MGINNTFQQRVDMKQLKRKLLIQHIVRGIEIFVLSNSFEGGLLSCLVYKSFYVYEYVVHVVFILARHGGPID